MKKKNSTPEGSHPPISDPQQPAPNRHRHRWGRQLTDNEKLLSECRSGDLCTVKRILNGGPIRHRLLEMGLNPGTEVRIVKYAPLKDPLECVLKDYHIALRVAEANYVIVQPKKH